MKKLRKFSLEELDRLTNSEMNEITGGDDVSKPISYTDGDVSFGGNIANKLPPVTGISVGIRF